MPKQSRPASQLSTAPPVKRHDGNSYPNKTRTIERAARASEATAVRRTPLTRGASVRGGQLPLYETSRFCSQPFVNVIPDRHRRRACPPMTNAGSDPEEGSGELWTPYSSFDCRRPRTSALAGLILRALAYFGLSRILWPWTMGKEGEGRETWDAASEAACAPPPSTLHPSGSLGGERGKASPGDRRWSRGNRERLKEKPDPGPQASPSGLSNKRGL